MNQLYGSVFTPGDNANVRVHNWRGPAHVGNWPIWPILIGVCKHLSTAGMPTSDALRNALNKHGAALLSPGGLDPNPLPHILVRTGQALFMAMTPLGAYTTITAL